MFATNNTLQPAPQDFRSVSPLAGKKIMIVDDEHLILGLLKITLTRPGFYVLTANSAISALEMLDSVTPDLFILDVMMPTMDGLELCRRIRARAETANTPVLIVSARYDPDIVDKAHAAGANEYVSKLTPQMKLLIRVREMLDAHANPGSNPQ
jgi:DNA-binding response OmpR family regulator